MAEVPDPVPPEALAADVEAAADELLGDLVAFL